MPGTSPSSRAAAAWKTASSRRTGTAPSKQRDTCSRYGSLGAGLRPGVGLERDQLGPQPRPARRIVDLRLDAFGKIGSVDDQPLGRPELLQVHLRLEIGRAEVAVDEPRDPLVEPKGKEEVVAGDRVRGRDVSFAADGRDPRPIGHSLRTSGGFAVRCPSPAPAPASASSPTNGIAWRSTASRLIRRAAVFCSATSRT